MRLTNDYREKLNRRVLAYRFQSVYDQLCDDYATLANDVYLDVYDNATRQHIMDKIPQGWLPKDHKIHVRFGGTYHAMLSFCPNIYGVALSYKGKVKHTSSRVFPAKDIGSCLKLYSQGHPFVVRYLSLQEREEKLRDDYRNAKKQVSVVLGSVRTVKRLLEVWPEVAPFLDEFDTKPNKLPAVNVAKVNENLNLPIEKE